MADKESDCGQLFPADFRACCFHSHSNSSFSLILLRPLSRIHAIEPQPSLRDGQLEELSEAFKLHEFHGWFSEELRSIAALKGRSPNGEALLAHIFVPKSSVICPGCRVAKPPLCHQCHQWLSASASFRLSFVDSLAPAHVACGGLRPSAPSARALRCSLSSVKRIRGVVSRIASAAAQGLRCMLWILLPSATSLPFPSSLHQPC